MAAQVTSTEAWKPNRIRHQYSASGSGAEILAFSSGRERETGFSSSPETEGLRRCLLFAPLFIEELECVAEESASPHPSKIGHDPPSGCGPPFSASPWLAH